MEKRGLYGCLMGVLGDIPEDGRRISPPAPPRPFFRRFCFAFRGVLEAPQFGFALTLVSAYRPRFAYFTFLFFSFAPLVLLV